MTRGTNERVLLVTRLDEDAPGGGRELLYRLNQRCLMHLFDEGFHCCRLGASTMRLAGNVFGSLRGYIDGATPSAVARVAEIVEREGIDKLFVDGSNLGRIAAGLKRRAPHVKVYTFFHNVEARFFWGALRSRKSPRALAVLIANYLAERAAVRHSDVLIFLSARDDRLRRKIYGGPPGQVAPLALDEGVAPQRADRNAPAGSDYLLFVGGAFYANLLGIGWFARHVAPRLAIKTCVVGRGMEQLADKIDAAAKVEIVGAVEDLDRWYRSAYAVVAPIFDGSGMKTKVAEAMMYGKKVIGSEEAFSGYEEVAAEVGWQCRTADQFVAAIERAHAARLPRFDPHVRRLYEEHHSFAAACTRLARIMDVAPAR